MDLEILELDTPLQVETQATLEQEQATSADQELDMHQDQPQEDPHMPQEPQVDTLKEQHTVPHQVQEVELEELAMEQAHTQEPEQVEQQEQPEQVEQLAGTTADKETKNDDDEYS